MPCVKYIVCRGGVNLGVYAPVTVIGEVYRLQGRRQFGGLRTCHRNCRVIAVTVIEVIIGGVTYPTNTSVAFDAAGRPAPIGAYPASE